MFEQPADFCAESDALYNILSPLDDAQFNRPTLFKGWTINDVLSHLHTWNRAADASLNDAGEFAVVSQRLGAALAAGKTIREFEKSWQAGLAGRALLEAWRGYYREMTPRFTAADPKLRVKWVGPDMSVRSSITARLMETWAHGQAVYDMLGIERADADRIKNIAVLAVNTFGWAYVNRGLKVPENPPHIRLTGPSGALWSWNPPAEDNLIEGAATEFCQAAAQVRNVADTHLKVVGETAKHWMSIIQCFAGPPEQPPALGTRFVNRR